MYQLSHLKKSTKIFIIIMTFVTFLSLAIIVYLEETNNSIFESVSHYFVGDTESEITVEEIIPHEQLKLKDDNLNEGITEIRQEGKDGKKEITFRVTMDKDGNEINRTYVSEEIVAEAVDEIIAIGTKIPSLTENYNYNQSKNISQSPNDDSNNSSDASNSTNDIHYCANLMATGAGVYEAQGYYALWFYKIDRPCEQYWTDPDVYQEISSEVFYSGTLMESQYASDGVIEVRRKLCKSVQEGEDNPCLKM